MQNYYYMFSLSVRSPIFKNRPSNALYIEADPRVWGCTRRYEKEKPEHETKEATKPESRK